MRHNEIHFLNVIDNGKNYLYICLCTLHSACLISTGFFDSFQEFTPIKHREHYPWITLKCWSKKPYSTADTNCSQLNSLDFREMHLQFLKNLCLTEFKRPPNIPVREVQRMTLFPWWNPTCSVFLSPFFAHTGLISVGSTTPCVSLLGILIPQCSSLHSNHKSFLVIWGNFSCNQHTLLVLKVNVISVTKCFNTSSVLSGFTDCGWRCVWGEEAERIETRD